eukprot:TRINITY_DN14165_c0_g1_i1.p1 TRINITY_DN14165_c0_g1~~TRINITY_DN14165_c0_g1_i1.p1  ORF type:complete len:197 (-),score=30.10 TRINITY_DN14165_c0_g1_i1:170-760(-)
MQSESSNNYIPTNECKSTNYFQSSEDSIHNKKASKVYKDKSFWYFLRQHKKVLRASYQQDMQEAYERGVRVGKQSDKVKMDERFKYGYSLGAFKALKSLDTLTINSELSTIVPRFVNKLFKETATLLVNLKSDNTRSHETLKKALKEGIFCVKKPTSPCSIKKVFNKRKRKRSLLNEVPEKVKLKKSKMIVQVNRN